MALIPLPTAARAYLASPTADNARENAATARDQHDVFPRGPIMPVGFYGISTGRCYDMKDGNVGPRGNEVMLNKGITLWGPQYGSGACRLQNHNDPVWGASPCSGDFAPVSNAAWLKANHRKGVYHIRPVPKNKWVYESGAWKKVSISATELNARTRTAFKSTAGKAQMKKFIEDSIAKAIREGDDAIAYWHMGPDDAESTGDAAYVRWADDIVSKADPKHRPCQITYKSDRSTGTLRAAGAYREVFGKQHYVMGYNGYHYLWEADRSKLAIPVPSGSWNSSNEFRWWSSQHRSFVPHMQKKITDGIIAAGRQLGGSTPSPYSRYPSASMSALQTYADPAFSDDGANGAERWNTWVPKCVKHDIWSTMAAGATGICFYTWNVDGYNNRTRGVQYEEIFKQTSILTESNMGRALIWGKKKADSEIQVLSGRTTHPMGWGPGTVENNASSFYFKNMQYRGRRYIIVCNSHPKDTLSVKLKKVRLPGTVLHELISNTKTTGSGSDLTISLRPLEVKVYRVASAPGYEGTQDDDNGTGGGGPGIQPVNPIVSGPVSIDAAIEDNVSFTVTANPGTGAPSNDTFTYQWYWKNPTYGAGTATEWVPITGKTSRTYSKTNVTLPMTNDEFKCLVRSSTGGSTYSATAVLTVGSGGTSGQTANIRVVNAWKAVKEVRVRVGGQWKLVSQIKVRVGGAWKNLVVPADPTPVITQSPQSVTLDEGATRPTLRMNYTSVNPATVKWEWRNTSIGKGWSAIAGATGKTYTLNSDMTMDHDGEEFRAVVTALTKTATTSAAKITITAKVNPELVINGTFNSNTNGWQVTTNGKIERTSGGELKVTNHTGDRGYRQARNIKVIPAIKNEKYNVSFKLSSHTSMACSFMVLDGENGKILLDIYGSNSNKGKTYSGQLTATSNQLWIRAQVGSNAIGQSTIIDNISIKKV